MKKLIFAIVIGIGFIPHSAFAQSAARVAPYCGGGAIPPLTVGTNAPLYMSPDAQLCTFTSIYPSGTPIEIVGNVANDAVDTGFPVKVGGKAAASNVAAGDRVDAWYGTFGQAAVGLTGIANPGDGTSATSAIALGGGAGLPMAVSNFVFNGTNWDRMRSTGSAGALLVENGPYAFGRATADTQIKGSGGFIHTITIAPTGAVVAGVLTVYNSTTESGTVIFSTALPVTTFQPFTVTLDVAASTGIYVGFDATLANVQVTASYR